MDPAEPPVKRARKASLRARAEEEEFDDYAPAPADVVASVVDRPPQTKRVVDAPGYAPPPEWRTTGSRYIGRWVVRSVVGHDQEAVAQLGYVVGWLSARESDFVNARGRPAGLYRCVYVGGELDGDCEDLELHETTAALWPHSCSGCMCFACDKRVLARHRETCEAAAAATAAAVATEALTKQKFTPRGGGATTGRRFSRFSFLRFSFLGAGADGADASAANGSDAAAAAPTRQPTAWSAETARGSASALTST
mmetsp:Transcript_34600/g.106974  ORF Transcript_34600/g.106974 Transcript_34600/m.106974 type:complete len:253 (+) Transcript_34600:173-931(+)